MEIKRNQRLDITSKKILLNSYIYEKNTAEEEKVIVSKRGLIKRVCERHKIPISTVRLIVDYYEKTGEVKNTRSIKRGPYKPVDSFTEEAIGRLIMSYHIRGEHITAAKILKEVKDNDFGFNGQLSTFYKLLKKMGFVWATPDPRKRLIEKPHIIRQRIQFMRQYLNNLKSNEPRTVIFLDETWVFANGLPTKTWIKEDNIDYMPNIPLNTGKRFIIVHAGSNFGFVSGAGLMFSSKINTEDYHGEMNGENFLKWVKEQLIPGIEKDKLGKCIIVMDNAAYHSTLKERSPTTAWKKADLIQWLQSNGIDVPENSLKAELIALTKQHKQDLKTYVIDEVLRENGHYVLRLPPYHCHFNPIELIWSQCKRYYNKQISITPGDINIRCRTAWQNALAQVTPQNWANCVNHVNKLIEDCWNMEMGNLETNDDECIIINLESSSESDDDDDVDL